MAKSIKHKLPEVIDIYGLFISIEMKHNLREEYDAIGTYYEKDQVIEIQSDLEPDDEMITFLHECGHVIFRRLSFCEGIDSQLEEAIVDTFAKWMVENFYILPK